MKIEYLQPDFLFCEVPIKDKSFNDTRVWIYSRLSLSLIEVILVNNFKDFEFKGFQERYEYINIENVIEDYFLIFVQNNCAITNNDQKTILDSAWNFYEFYLNWKNNNNSGEML